MKATQFTTASGFFMRKTEVFPSDIESVGALKVNVNDTPITESFRGFGVALTGSSCYNLAQMEPESRKGFLTDIYTSVGLDLQIGRIPIGSCDYSPELYSYDDIKDDTALAHFSVEKDEAYILPMIHEVIRTNPDIYLFASPWSPPGWMKTGDSMCGGYMRDRYIECYARYFLRFLEEYEKRGVFISAVTPQNEPHAEQDARYPTCMWHPEIEAKFILELRKKLNEAGRNTEIWMHDHGFEKWSKILWCFKEYPELLDACGSIAFHYYDYYIEMTDIIRQAHPALHFHFTEGGPRLYDNYATDHCKWGIMMAKALNRGFLSFTGWNLLLDETGGPNIGPFFCGGLATRNTQTGELSYSGQYHALRHFSGFIKKNARIYAAKADIQGMNLSCFPHNPLPTEVCAAENPDGSFVLQIVNPDKNKVQLQYAFRGKRWYIEALPDSVSTVVFEEKN